MSSQPAEVEGILSDAQELMKWRPLVGLLAKYRAASGAPAKLCALIDCVMFVLDRIEPGGAANLRRALAYTQAAAETSPSFKKLICLLAEVAGERPPAEGFRPTPGSG
jgi:hypothetical protein